MITRVHKTKGQASMEFIALVLFVGVAVVIFYPSLRNTMSGRWHLAGDSLSYGMVYQPGKGISCTHDAQYDLWYKSDCFETNNCDTACFSSALRGPGADRCQTCLQGCSSGC